MQIDVAKSAGFCFGVERAVKMALKAANAEDGHIFMLGDIVHNEHVVQRLKKAGIQVVASLDRISAGTLVVRAHGTTPEVYEAARRKGLTVIDATCPLVLEIHNIAVDLQQQGYTMVIIGDHAHDEVVGIAGYLAASQVVSSPEEAEQLPKMSRIGVVVQSTQNIENVQRLVGVLAGKCRELRFVNTICPATTKRQRDIRQLPHEHEVVVIIGSYSSANTCRMTEIAQRINPRTYQVETADDVQAEWFKGVSSVGISAGASTPNEVIQAVVERIRSLGNTN